MPGWLGAGRVALAVVFTGWTLLCATCWIAASRPTITVELGFAAPTFLTSRHGLLIDGVTRDSPAERAGLRRGDVIVAIDGEALVDTDSQPVAWARHRPGDRVRLTVETSELAGWV